MRPMAYGSTLDCEEGSGDKQPSQAIITQNNDELLSSFAENDPRRVFSAPKLLILLFFGFVVALSLAMLGSFGIDVPEYLVNLASNPSHAPSRPANKPITIVDTVFVKDPHVAYASTEELAVVATNEYGNFAAPYPWLKTVEGSQLIEPYKDTTLTLTGSLVLSGLYTFKWSLTDYTGEFVDGAITQVITVKSTGSRQLTVSAYDSSGVLTKTFTTLLICKYVKREIRSLTVADRERFLDAAVAMWQYSEGEGKAKFGDKFTSISTFVAAHSLASNDIMCDGFHEGSGFITHHLALGNSFEASLRAVDPAVVLPYWDFTIEGQQIHQSNHDPSYMMDITPVLSDEWFGNVDENYHISNSRWAHILMPTQQDDGSGVRNSYGYIRSYWNNNNDPEVSRRLFNVCGLEPKNKVIPSCLSHYDVLNATTLGDFQTLSPGDGHGPLHVQLGGIWGGCEEAYEKFSKKWGHILDADMTDDEITKTGIHGWRWGNTAPRRYMLEYTVMGEYFHVYRSLWRSHMCAADGSFNLLVCPDSCDENTPFEECSCQVDKLVSGETSWENLYPCVISENNRDTFEATWPKEMLRDLVYMMSTASVMEGEMIESASTADILFWIIHPAIERLLSAKRLPDVTMMGPYPFYKWPDADGSEETWLQYSYYDLKKDQNPFHKDPYTCVGHAATDSVLPTGFKLPYTDAMERVVDADGDGVVTNWEFFIALDPNNGDGNDYVFDNFLWDHCDRF